LVRLWTTKFGFRGYDCFGSRRLAKLGDLSLIELRLRGANCGFRGCYHLAKCRLIKVSVALSHLYVRMTHELANVRQWPSLPAAPTAYE